jgi:hypothetical protein
MTKKLVTSVIFLLLGLSMQVAARDMNSTAGQTMEQTTMRPQTVRRYRRQVRRHNHMVLRRERRMYRRHPTMRNRRMLMRTRRIIRHNRRYRRTHPVRRG